MPLNIERDELELELLKIVGHKTLEEHTAVELIMGLFDTYCEQQVVKARLDEIGKINAYCGRLTLPGYLGNRIAELQQEITQ